MKKLGQLSAAHLAWGRAAFQRMTNGGDICRLKLLRTEEHVEKILRDYFSFISE